MALPIIPAPAALVAYKFYRILKYKNPDTTGTTSGYFSLNTFGIFETVESTTDIALASAGAVATAEVSYNSSTTPDKAIDGNASTYWESTSKAFPTWFQVELPTARVARKFTVSHTTYSGEAPENLPFLDQTTVLHGAQSLTFLAGIQPNPHASPIN
jgi:hypothetical protein